ncbi:unnamed protein product [Haemonchus placei]|uniref:Uncharacterized protein n=1 Tax=Haemonchus placei TaxID=6290 RepID=A0A0N4WU15_HAEPC|nr:unnamed protein product [Haemonchus placei]
MLLWVLRRVFTSNEHEFCHCVHGDRKQNHRSH